MPAIMVPKSSADAPNAGRDFTFPEGSFIGTIDEIRVREFPDFIDPTGNRGYSSTDGEILSIQIGEISSMETDGPDVGNAKHFVDFIVRDGNVEITEGPGIPEKSWQMQKSAAMLTNLAIALGATEEVEGEDGTVYVATTDDFLDTLRDGGFKGSKVGFVTRHRNWTSKKTGKTGTEVQTQEFFQAV